MAEPQSLADQFLGAAVEPLRWLDVLERVAADTRSRHAQIVGVGPDFSFGFNWVNAMDASAHAAADRAELMTPATNYRVAAGVATSSQAIVFEDTYAAIRPRLASDAYLDLCSDLDIPNGCQTNLVEGAEGLIGFALLRSARDGPTTPETRALFATISASARTAASLQVALERESAKLVAGSFEAIDLACFVLDRTMRVRALSRGAEEVLARGALRLVDGWVSVPGTAAQRRLAGAMAAVMANRAAAASLAAPDGAGTLMMKLHRLPAREWNMGFAPFAILTVKRPLAACPTDVAFLRDGYGLTATEAEIALLLRQGRSRDQVREMRGITQETLRSHLRALFAKLGVKRETEAIHLLHALLS